MPTAAILGDGRQPGPVRPRLCASLGRAVKADWECQTQSVHGKLAAGASMSFRGMHKKSVQLANALDAHTASGLQRKTLAQEQRGGG